MKRKSAAVEERTARAPDSKTNTLRDAPDAALNLQPENARPQMMPQAGLHCDRKAHMADSPLLTGLGRAKDLKLFEILRPHGLSLLATPRLRSRRLAHRLRVGSSTDHPSPLGDNTRKRKVGRTTDKVQNQMNLWPCTSRALFSANHQRTTSRTDPHTHDPHFSLSSPAVPPARSADRRGRARQSQMHGFVMQKIMKTIMQMPCLTQRCSQRRNGDM